MLIILCIIFISLILLIGGNSSAKSLITISLNTLMLLSVIFFIYKGFNPLTVSIPACVLISIIAVFYQNGYNIKTKTAFISILIILAIMLPIVYLWGGMADIQRSEEHTSELQSLIDLVCRLLLEKKKKI